MTKEVSRAARSFDYVFEFPAHVGRVARRFIVACREEAVTPSSRFITGCHIIPLLKEISSRNLIDVGNVWDEKFVSNV